MSFGKINFNTIRFFTSIKTMLTLGLWKSLCDFGGVHKMDKNRGMFLLPALVRLPACPLGSPDALRTHRIGYSCPTRFRKRCSASENISVIILHTVVLPLQLVRGRFSLLTLAMSVIVFALSINFLWSILTFRNLYGEKYMVCKFFL